MPTPSTKRPTRYMDFISRKPFENSDPLASRPDTRPVKQPRPVVKAPSVADQIPPKGAHVEKPPLKNIIHESEVAVKKDAEKPFISREPATSRDLYAEPPADSDKTQAATTSALAEHLAMRASVTLSGDSKKAESSQPASPDGNAYSLGGKSPFLPNYTVDKRPLSDSVPSKKKDEQFEKLSYLGVGDQGAESTHRKNIYAKSTESSADQSDSSTSNAEPVRIIDDAKKRHGVPTWLIIIITIILGAAVGAGVYFLLPK